MIQSIKNRIRRMAELADEVRTDTVLMSSAPEPQEEFSRLMSAIDDFMVRYDLWEKALTAHTTGHNT